MFRMEVAHSDSGDKVSGTVSAGDNCSWTLMSSRNKSDKDVFAMDVCQRPCQEESVVAAVQGTDYFI